MSADRPTKLARLQSLQRSVPYVSKSALSKILENVAAEGPPELFTRKQILESTANALGQATRYGPLLQQCTTQKSDGSTGLLWITNFWSYLAALYWQGGSYSDLFKSASHQMNELNPLQLVIYTDEVIPGNILGKCERRTWCIYASFMNFDLETLGSEYSWLLLAAIKTSTVAQLDAGIGQVVGIVLKSIFFNPLCPAVGGVLLPSQDSRPLRVYLKLEAILQDGSGHKYTFNAKGDSGWKYCLLCSAHGAVTQATGVNDTEGEDVVVHQLKLSDLLVHTDQEILESFDRLKANHSSMAKKNFEIWQKACGLTYNPHCLLLDTQLREDHILQPATQYLHDWMHCTVSAGIFQVAVFVLAMSLENGWSYFHDYVKLWHCPKHWPQHLDHLFSPKQTKKYQSNQKFQCQASEALALLPILTYFVKSFLLQKELLDKKVAHAFLTVASIVDLVHLGQVWQMCTPAMLHTAAETCLQAWADAGLTEWMIKKFHWVLHLGPAMARFKKLPACFAMERKHRFVCKFANAICNTSVYEKSLLQELLAEELFHLAKPNVFTTSIHLLKGRVPGKALAQLIQQTLGHTVDKADLLVSAKCKLKKTICTKDDIVLAQPFQAMQILVFVSYASNIWALARLLQFKEDQETCGACVWVQTESNCLVPAASILYPLVYTTNRNEVTTLVPWQLRSFIRK